MRPFFLEIVLLIMVFGYVVTVLAAVTQPSEGEQKSDLSAPAVFVYDSKGKRDPFAPPGQGGGDAISRLKMDGVIEDKAGMYAIISGQVVKVGDKVFDAEVVDIQKESVILEYKKNRVELKMPPRTGEENKPKEE